MQLHICSVSKRSNKIQKCIFRLRETAIKAHVARSVTKSNEFPQKRDQWKMYPTYMYFKGMYSLKSFTMGFWYFFPKNGSKRPKNGPKMSWFCLVWFVLARL